jgi:hypothetical protein
MSELYYYARVTSTKFVVQNIVPYNKTVKIFSYPVYNGCTRDLLSIPGVSEADIRYSLLKGDLALKLQYKELTVVESNIDLLQFNDDQRTFLETNGVTEGLQISISNLDTIKLEDIQLVGPVDSVNNIFYIPSGFFIYNDNYKILVYRNGVRQAFLDDYMIAESGGPGTGFNTVIFTNPPLSTPTPPDIITADYYIANS